MAHLFTEQLLHVYKALSRHVVDSRVHPGQQISSFSLLVSIAPYCVFVSPCTLVSIALSRLHFIALREPVRSGSDCVFPLDPAFAFAPPVFLALYFFLALRCRVLVLTPPPLRTLHFAIASRSHIVAFSVSSRSRRRTILPSCSIAF